ncbi:MAG: hypothetical protein WDA20_01715 [Desulfuromonadales bacterium]
MLSYIENNTQFFALLIGFVAFFIIASGFNHRQIGKVEDKTVAILAVFIAILCGMVAGLCAFVIAIIFFP